MPNYPVVLADTKSQSLLARLKSAGMKFPGRANNRRRRRSRRNRPGGGRGRRGAPASRGGLQSSTRTDGGLRPNSKLTIPTAYGNMRGPSSNPKLFGGLMSRGSVMDPEYGVGEQVAIQSYITDINSNGDGGVETAIIPFLTSGGALSSQAFSGFGVGGTNFTGIDLNPAYFLQSRLGTYATLYNRYRWRTVKSTYFTGTQTSLPGQLSQGISSDPIVFPESNGFPSPVPSYQSINNHNSTTTGPTWDNFSTVYKYSGGKAWYTRDPQDIPGQPTIGGEDTAADLRSIIQCRLMGLMKFIGLTVLRSYGFVEIAGVLEFFDPVNTTATAATAPIPLIGPLDEKRHALLKHSSGIPTVVKRGRVIPLGDNKAPLFDKRVFNPKLANLHYRPSEDKFKTDLLETKSTHSDESTGERSERVTLHKSFVPLPRPLDRNSTPMSWEETG